MTQMTTVSIQQQSSNCSHKCIFNIASQFIWADCIHCVSNGSRSMTNWQFLEATFLKTDWECRFHSLSIMMLNVINIKLETEITSFLNNLCNMLSGRNVLSQSFRNYTPFINTWCFYLYLSNFSQVSTHPGTRTHTPDSYSLFWGWKFQFNVEIWRQMVSQAFGSA